MHLDRKAVDVDGYLPRGVIAARRAEMARARFGQRVAQRRAVGGRAD